MNNNTEPADWPYCQLSDEQLMNNAQEHSKLFERAWATSMRTHYKSGLHIDAQITMKKHYESLLRLSKYIYNNRPAATYDQFCELANWAPQSH